MRQLRPDEVDELVAAYKAGTTARELAARFGIHRMTVGKHLRSCGIDTTPPGMTPDQLTNATMLYETGEPLSRISDTLKVPQSTLREHLLAAGVKMREAVKPRKSQKVSLTKRRPTRS
jgi:DNA-directed RNA polymerase specialized sigma24 family protein